MENIPSVSILIPCYNAEQWVGEAIESALSQTWPLKEVIVVDDGSTDGSLTAISKFGAAVKVVRSSKRGGNHARNIALNLSTGEWLQFLDADDYLQPSKIALQFNEAFDKNTADVIYSPVYIQPSACTGTQRSVSAIDTALDIYAQWIAWQVPQTGGALWRRSTLRSLGGWNEDQSCCQEHELYLRALKAHARFAFAPSPNAVYRIWSEQTVCRRDPRLVVSVRTALVDEMLAWLISQHLLTRTHELIAGRAFFEMARTLAKYDVTEGDEYHFHRKRRGLINLAGPAAPLPYRLAYYAIGFASAERLAARGRRP